jgi:dTDP-4-dehydrorhamnose reductase
VRLQSEGVDIRAVTAWSLLGATDWNSLLTRQTGFYEPGVFDIRAPRPRPTAMVGLLRDLAITGHCDHPVLDSPGWWSRRDRLQYPPVRCHSLTHPSPPLGSTGKRRSLIIIGARGTLGQALARACVIRALPHHLLGRETLDIADSSVVSRVLAELRPWAVINAAGCVDVDLAERDTARCWRDNCTGPEKLADACADMGIPLVTFSSDLVFDGGKSDPYLETDPVGPLNVYGHSKAAAESAVLSRHAGSLIVRTSAFFGPSDRYNFATQTLVRLKAGEEVAAVVGFAISPTYVPDLVDHTLDLLIDGESGIWHLANRGSISWYEFARELASAWGLDHGLIRAAAPAEAGWIALRPANSTLESGRGSIMPRFESALGRFVDALRNRGELPALPAGLLRDPAPSRVLCRSSG